MPTEAGPIIREATLVTELAKDARGTADSFKAVLADGANEVIEQAPEKIEQAGYQAQQLADELSNRFNSARDVVTELAEAFRSGWEEYGEDQPIDELAAAPALLADDEGEKNVSVSENQAVDNKVGHASQIEPQSEPSVNTKPDLEPIIPSMASRRRSQPTAYSMHIANEQPATHAEEKAEAKPKTVAKPDAKQEVKPAKKEVREPEAVAKSSKPSSYTTRVLEETKKVEVAKPKAAKETAPKKAEAKPKKKLLFRRTAK